MIEVIKTDHYRIDIDKECHCLRLILFSSHFGHRDVQMLISHLKIALSTWENSMDAEGPNESRNGRGSEIR